MVGTGKKDLLVCADPRVWGGIGTERVESGKPVKIYGGLGTVLYYLSSLKNGESSVWLFPDIVVLPFGEASVVAQDGPVEDGSVLRAVFFSISGNVLQRWKQEG